MKTVIALFGRNFDRAGEIIGLTTALISILPGLEKARGLAVVPVWSG